MASRIVRSVLDDFGLIAVRGPDTRNFLQGQLSQDVLALGSERVALAGLHNPQGRALAILRLVPLDRDDLLLMLPKELLAMVVQRLRRFVLRAKLQLGDETADWICSGLAGPDAAAALTSAGLAIDRPGRGAFARHQRRLAWRHDIDPERFIVLAPAALGLPADWPAPIDPADALRAWHAADIAAGLPQIRTATSEVFVAQMLNLDLLEGVSFNKGCYTGQEVIARAHYRGRVKRRLQRFRSRAAVSALPSPGATLTLTGDANVRVVEAVQQADGRIEFLAVAPLAQSDAVVDAPSTDVASSSDAATTLEVENLPLPYALPE
ncbi:MAG: hypothetical protein R3E75_11200 [Steroidobacteraceae bacterium]|nr:folate-binding protein YgfZ [Nevskiaceae bacterium]MCP5339673.1 folate-binding protein YgfZ [Nevskiaceae bacterium]MCP5360674.1 folate-binding protein YgfZ [Nevskiaceae bacterium]